MLALRWRAKKAGQGRSALSEPAPSSASRLFPARAGHKRYFNQSKIDFNTIMPKQGDIFAF
ncbi:hypothetical protein [Allofranklinella schreckenbergeri]|uniref:hypothetical protein n=1 Tax=Allofranklinella schreckenbergeri TaxID=1076744 RepID=UPI0011C3752F|nr:hypothetical protein [Allofranklinella schreckenbergeri]